MRVPSEPAAVAPSEEGAIERPLPSKRPNALPYRHAYLYFTLALLVTMAGFWPSFLRRLGETDLAHMIHGVSATLWMTVPVMQAWLIQRRSFEWHSRLGKLSLLLAPILVVSGLHMVQIMILKVPGLSQTLRMKFAFLDISAMLFFVLFLSLALKSIYRGEVKTHAQYMSCTVLIALEPGLERLLLYRIPNIGSFDVALNVALVLMAAIAAALLYSEWRSDRVRLPYVVLLAFFLTVHLLLEPVATSSTFQSFARWFATL